MDEDWKRLGLRIKAERRLRGRMTQAELADLMGVDTNTVKNLEKGDFRRAPSSLPHLERAFGWSAGDARIVARGGEPALSARTDADAADTSRRPFKRDPESGAVIYEWDPKGRPTAFMVLVEEARDMPDDELAEVIMFLRYRRQRRLGTGDV